MNNTRTLGLVAALVGAASMGASGPLGPAVQLEPACTCGQRGLPDAGTTRRGRCKRCRNPVARRREPGKEQPVASLYDNKPADYHERRRWQNVQRQAGLPVECGREACHKKTGQPWVNSGTPLLYCEDCAKRINRMNGMALCLPEGIGRED